MGSVLLVDDDRVQQLFISKMLLLNGLNVIVANDGIEALEKIDFYCPNILILDIVLPKMNGYEVCRRIKKNKGTQGIPVIMFIGLTQIARLNTIRSSRVGTAHPTDRGSA